MTNEAAYNLLNNTMEDEATNSIAMLNVVIEESDEGYIARIDSISVHEKRTEPPK